MRELAEISAAHARTRSITTPEGVPLSVELAGVSVRGAAFAVDLCVSFGVILVLALINLAFAGSFLGDLTAGVAFFAAAMLRAVYFILFEIIWSGQTPGKRVFGLRVIDRNGGVLTPDAIVARNLSREIEYFFPLTMIFNAHGSEVMAYAVWLLLTSIFPLINRDGLRIGDLIGGTLVIVVPKRQLLEDLSTRAHHFTFTDAQLERYGIRELQVLEDLLRLPETMESERVLSEVAGKIQRRINWTTPVRSLDMHAFLNDFYAAQRAFLELRKHLGEERADKHFQKNTRSHEP